MKDLKENILSDISESSYKYVGNLLSYVIMIEKNTKGKYSYSDEVDSDSSSVSLVNGNLEEERIKKYFYLSIYFILRKVSRSPSP